MHRGGGGSKLSRATSISPQATIEKRRYARDERATGRTALLTANASGGVSCEAQSSRLGFTMAEILLSLTIIGVVAAITLPSLTGNINERTWNTQRKALYARFSQAIALMPALNGYGSTETFVTSGLAKVLKINNICDHEHLPDCGITSKVTGINGSVVFEEFPQTMQEYNSVFNNVNVSTPVTNAAAFETANGESIVVYYNPECVTSNDASTHVSKFMCANFIYDLNGTKGPNAMGKDIGFITAFYSTDSNVVAPMPDSRDIDAYSSHSEAHRACTKRDGRLPNIDELSALFLNKPLANITSDVAYWSNSLTLTTSAVAWTLYTDFGYRFNNNDNEFRSVRCIKR